MRIKIILLAILGLAIFFISGCQQHGTPKPRAYYRITFPEHEYEPFDQESPYSFEKPIYADVRTGNLGHLDEKYWYNLFLPSLKGTVHVSYKPIKDNLFEMLEDSRKLAYKHAIKADAIGERLFISPDKNVYGTLFDIKGDAASPVQFYLTDSLNHFVRGSLYFDAIPNKDSLAPVVEFVKMDIIHMMETFEWK